MDVEFLGSPAPSGVEVCVVLRRSVTFILISLLIASLGSGAQAGDPSGEEPAPAEGVYMVTDRTLDTTDGVTISFTVFRTTDMTATQPAPLVLHSHGWGGSRATGVSGMVKDLLDAGYGVLSFDARGHGDSTGYATLQHRDHEVQDYILLLDWVADNLLWVQREGAAEEKDLVLGAVGGSYGGAYQLNLASVDPRLDAIVPEMTWNDLRYSLAPQGVVKTVWVDALYAAGTAQVDMDPRIHDWFLEAQLTNRLPAAAAEHFVGANPVPENIMAATLLVQGLPDMLFNWNEAQRTYDGIRAGGNPDVALVGSLDGHVLPYPVQPIGAMGPPRGGEPCGAYGDLAIAWFDHHLKGAAVAVPQNIWYALEDGTCLRTGGPGMHTTNYDIFAAPSGGGSILMPTRMTEGVIAGVPTVSGFFKGATDTTLFFSLVACDGCDVVGGNGGPPVGARLRVLDDQVAAIRFESNVLDSSTTFHLELNGVAGKIGDGSKLYLRIDGLNEWYAHNSARTPGPALLGGVTLDVPFTGFVCLSGVPSLYALPNYLHGLDCQV